MVRRKTIGASRLRRKILQTLLVQGWMKNDLFSLFVGDP
jgi:hypothetical protein